MPNRSTSSPAPEPSRTVCGFLSFVFNHLSQNDQILLAGALYGALGQAPGGAAQAGGGMLRTAAEKAPPGSFFVNSLTDRTRLI